MARDFSAEDTATGGASTLEDVLRRRRTAEQQPPAPDPEPAPEQPPAAPAAASPNSPTPAKSRRPNGTTRSWYLPFDVADDLAAAADGLFYDLRGQLDKSVILGVLIRVGLDRPSLARERLDKMLTRK